MILRPIERGQVFHRASIGKPLFHVRLKYNARTLAVLSADSHEEAHDRAQRLAAVLLPDHKGVTIEAA